jgi:hypothetical protein
MAESSSDSDSSLSEGPYVFKPKLPALSFQTLARKKKEQEEMDYYIGMYEEDHLAPTDEPPRSPLASVQSNSQDSSVPSIVVATKKKNNMTRWPQMTTLFREYEHDVYRLLLGAWETEATTEPSAKNGPNVKGNAWNKYHDHAFGGGEPERGLIKDFPVIKQVTHFKRKILEIWKYAVAHKEDVSKDVYELSVHQLHQYEEACRKEKMAKDSAASANEKLSNEMESFEKHSGALPPGAIGVKGAGRGQHSTNLVLGDPASYDYAHSKTPKKKNKPSSSNTPSSSQSAVASQKKIMSSIIGLDSMMKEVLETVKPAAKKAEDVVSSLSVDTDVNVKIQ